MLDINFDSLALGSRSRELEKFKGERVTLKAHSGRIVGTLEAVSPTSASVNASGRLVVVSLDSVASVLVHVGGDWLSTSHACGIKDSKINLRLRSAQKDFIARAASASHMTVSDFIMRATLAAASDWLNESEP